MTYAEKRAEIEADLTDRTKMTVRGPEIVDMVMHVLDYHLHHQENPVITFRKKPVQVEAWPIAWLLDSARAANPVFVNSAPAQAYYDGIITIEEDGIAVATLEGVMRAGRGDWLIRGVAGEFYPCKAEIFEATYEAVDA